MERQTAFGAGQRLPDCMAERGGQGFRTQENGGNRFESGRPAGKQKSLVRYAEVHAEH